MASLRYTKWSAISLMLSLLLSVSVIAQDDVDLFDMSLESLLDIKVSTASKSQEKLSDAPGVVSVLTQDEIKRFGGVTLKELLLRMPSLNMGTNYMTDRSMIVSRGDHVLAASGHILMLINGRPIREVAESGLNSEVLESFPVNIIERIEVIRGPGSVLYGSNAFSAVINVITKKAEKTDLSLTGLGGSSAFYHFDGETRMKFGDLSVLVAGKYAAEEKWNTTWEVDTNVIPFIPIFPAGGSDSSVTLSIPNEGPGAYLELDYRGFKVMGTYTEWTTDYIVGDYIRHFPAFGEVTWQKYWANLGYSRSLSEIWDMDFNAGYTGTHMEVTSWPTPIRNSYEVIGEWTNSVKPMDKLHLVLGALGGYIKGKEEAGGAQVYDANRYNVGFYAQADYLILEPLKFIGGVQGNKVQNSDLTILPRAGLIWSPLDFINVKGLYSQAYRAPSMLELEMDFAALQGNKNLSSEKVHTVDLGVNMHKDKVQLGVNGFFSKMVDVILQDHSIPVPDFKNIGEITFMGAEMEGKYYLNPEFYLTGSFLYQQNEDKDGNENVVPVPNIGAKAGISYSDKRGITASLFNVFQGDLDAKYSTTLNVSPGAYNLLNLYCAYDLNKVLNVKQAKKLSLVAKVDNMLDEEIWLADWNLAPGKSMPVNRGRMIYGGVDLGF